LYPLVSPEDETLAKQLSVPKKVKPKQVDHVRALSGSGRSGLRPSAAALTHAVGELGACADLKLLECVGAG
jgi:hypothetical protein